MLCPQGPSPRPLSFSGTGREGAEPGPCSQPGASPRRRGGSFFEDPERTCPEKTPQLPPSTPCRFQHPGRRGAWKQIEWGLGSQGLVLGCYVTSSHLFLLSGSFCTWVQGSSLGPGGSVGGFRLPPLGLRGYTLGSRDPLLSTSEALARPLPIDPPATPRFVLLDLRAPHEPLPLGRPFPPHMFQAHWPRPPQSAWHPSSSVGVLTANGDPAASSLEPLRSGCRRHSVDTEVVREWLALWSKPRPSGQLEGWTGGSRFLGWLMTHSPVSGKTPTPFHPDQIPGHGPASCGECGCDQGPGPGGREVGAPEMPAETPPLLGHWAGPPGLPG